MTNHSFLRWLHKKHVIFTRIDFQMRFHSNTAYRTGQAGQKLTYSFDKGR